MEAPPELAAQLEAQGRLMTSMAEAQAAMMGQLMQRPDPNQRSNTPRWTQAARQPPSRVAEVSGWQPQQQSQLPHPVRDCGTIVSRQRAANMVRYDSASDSLHQCTQLAVASEWEECKADNGHIYYYNTKTNASTWERPTKTPLRPSVVQPQAPELKQAALVSIREAEGKLEISISTATIQLHALGEEHARATKRLHAAKARLNEVNTLTNTVCEECWQLLPVLTAVQQLSQPKEVHEPGENSCRFCGCEPRHQGLEVISMPPENLTSLSSSVAARRQAEDVIHRGDWGPQDVSVHTRILQDANEASNSARVPVGSCTSLPAQMSRAFTVQQAESFVARAQSDILKVQHAITGWNTYSDRHTTELNMLQPVKVQLEPAPDPEPPTAEERTKELTNRLNMFAGKR